MTDQQFLKTINTSLRTAGVNLQDLVESKSDDSSALKVWAEFLEECVRHGVKLGDERWQRLTAADGATATAFSLLSGTERPADDDFRLGLQLFMGMFGTRDLPDTD